MRSPTKSAGFNRHLLLTSTLVLALATGACSADDGGDAEATAKPVTEAAAEQSNIPSGDNGALEDPVGARGDLVGFECAKEGGEWSASGVLLNSSDEEATYVVQVTVHSAKGGTVVGSAEDTLTVNAGKEADFEFGDLYSGKEKNLDCTPRIVRGS